MSGRGIVCGVWVVWVGQILCVDGITHRGSWVPINGALGECRTSCGLDELGFVSSITGGETWCPDCVEPTP